MKLSKLDNTNRTFKAKHFAAIVGVALFLLALNWFKSGFLLAGKPLGPNPIDITASNQAYKEWQSLASQPGDDAVAVVQPQNSGSTAIAEAPISSGQVLGDTDPAFINDPRRGPLPYIMNNVALPLLTGKFTTTQILDVHQRLGNALEQGSSPSY